VLSGRILFRGLMLALRDVVNLYRRSIADIALLAIAQLFGCSQFPTTTDREYGAASSTLESRPAAAPPATTVASASGFSFALDVAGPPCPAAQPGPRMVVLSEALAQAGGDAGEASCDDAFLVQQIIFKIGQTGKLIVDRTCNLNAGLRLPSRFTLEGLGPDGAGQFNFTHDGIALSICPEAPHGYLVIRDLAVYGPYAAGASAIAPHSIGLALANAHVIHIEDVRLTHFHYGITGTYSFSVFVDDSNVSSCRGDDIRLGYGANGWRIRDGIVGFAGNFGINVLGPGDAPPVQVGQEVWEASNDLLIDGVRMESDERAAVRTAGAATRVENCRFEGNGLSAFSLPHQAVVVEQTAIDTRILTNAFYAGDCIQDKSSTTKRGFNMPSDAVNCAPLPIAQ
jgi:hypothetical protein